MLLTFSAACIDHQGSGDCDAPGQRCQPADVDAADTALDVAGADTEAEADAIIGPDTSDTAASDTAASDTAASDIAASDTMASDTVASDTTTSQCSAPVQVDLSTGVFTFAADLQNALPIWFHLYLDLAVDPDTGTLAGIATLARLRTDEPAPASSSTAPEDFEVVLEADGAAFPIVACATSPATGQLLFTTVPVDARFTALATIPIHLDALVIQGTVSARANDRHIISGTLTTSGGRFGNPGDPSEGTLPPINTTWTGLGLRADEVPAELPRVCAADPCATYESHGPTCSLPDPYDPGVACGE